MGEHACFCAPGRRRLPARRPSVLAHFEHAGHAYVAAGGLWPDGTLGEIFIHSARPGSGIDIVAHDAAVTASLALQHGVPAEAIRAALLKEPDGSDAGVLGAAIAAVEGALEAVTASFSAEGGE